MHEFIARALYHFQVHLLFASLVAVAAWILTSFRRGSASTKYWIWVATSLNFILPTGAVVDKAWATHLSWATPLGIIGDAANSVSESTVAPLLFALWVMGSLLMFARLCLRLRAERRHVQPISQPDARDVKGSFLAHGVPVRFSRTRQAPAVNGVLRPHISLPHGIDRVLSQDELNAVLIHELTHARRRDNLIRLIYELALCGLWFHPLLWITGSRLALYRELSCDEPVIQSAHGGDLLSALAKLANPEDAFLLQASASSFLGHRLARLGTQPQSIRRRSSLLLAFVFSAVLLGSVFETVAHTACCFVVKASGSSCERKH